jgi:hypothetical protein
VSSTVLWMFSSSFLSASSGGLHGWQPSPMLPRHIQTVPRNYVCKAQLQTLYQFSWVEVWLVLPSPQRGVWRCDVTLMDDSDTPSRTRIQQVHHKHLKRLL